LGENIGQTLNEVNGYIVTYSAHVQDGGIVYLNLRLAIYMYEHKCGPTMPKAICC